MFLSLQLPLWPPSASTNSQDIDYLYIFLVVVTVIMTALIFAGVFTFAIKFRRKHPDEIPVPNHGSLKLEIAWSVIPFLVMLIMFFWGTKLYFDNAVPPKDVIDVYVTGKQWMWRVQYPEGQREINELHVPTGHAVRLTMASEDVIHSFFIPAFRIKKDVVPGHYNQQWFQATKPGRYHLFCAEYCGTEHSGMIGWVTVMEPKDYENWLNGGGTEGSMASQGEKMFQQLGCSTCHLMEEQGRCPILKGVYGSKVLLQDGRTVNADDAYIRESILNPNAKIVAGFKPDVMPSFQGQISEEGVLQLIVYIKSLAAKNTGVMGTPRFGPTSGVMRTGSRANEGKGTGSNEGNTAVPVQGRPEANRQILNRMNTTGGKK